MEGIIEAKGLGKKKNNQKKEDVPLNNNNHNKNLTKENLEKLNSAEKKNNVDC